MALKIWATVPLAARLHSLDCQENPVQRPKCERVRSKLRARRLGGKCRTWKKENLFNLYYFWYGKLDTWRRNIKETLL